MQVYLAEKPSVARDLAEAFSLSERRGPFFQGSYRGKKIVVAYARGHLFGIADRNAPKAWTLETLPILPERLELEPLRGVGDLLENLREVLREAEEVVIATDPGREGELIARLILLQLGWRRWDRTYRLWTAEALTPQVVRREAERLRPASEFESLYFSALARMEADWLVGINLTRLTTLLFPGRGVWSVGRVQTPTLRLIVEREESREVFVPVRYGVLEGVARDPRGVSFPVRALFDEEHPPLEKVKAVFHQIGPTPRGKVVEVEREEKEALPPLLYDLNTLQRDANARYRMSAKRTLSLAQALYEEHKVISYPRTESRHLPESAMDLVREVLTKLGRDDLLPQVDRVGKRVFDDTKLTDHHAIIPLDAPPPDLKADELRVYTLVRDRFLMAFHGPYRYTQLKGRLDVEGVPFVFQVHAVQNLGWRLLDPPKDVLAALPILQPGEKVHLRVQVREASTEPPKRYSEGALIKEMERLGLGTPATRAEILETLKERGYVRPEKQVLVPTEKGRSLVAFLRDHPVASPELTGRWEKTLDGIWRGKLGEEGYRSFMGEIRDFVAESVASLKEKGTGRGEEAMETEKGAGTAGTVRAGTTGTVETKRNGTEATPKMLRYARRLARRLSLKLEATDFATVSRFIEEAKAKLKEPLPQVCSCGKRIFRFSRGWKCEGGHVFWEESFGRRFKEEEALVLLAGGERLFHLKNKEGKPYQAYLRYDHEQGRLRIARFVNQ